MLGFLDREEVRVFPLLQVRAARCQRSKTVEIGMPAVQHRSVSGVEIVDRPGLVNPLADASYHLVIILKAAGIQAPVGKQVRAGGQQLPAHHRAERDADKGKMLRCGNKNAVLAHRGEGAVLPGQEGQDALAQILLVDGGDQLRRAVEIILHHRDDQRLGISVGDHAVQQIPARDAGMEPVDAVGLFQPLVGAVSGAGRNEKQVIALRRVVSGRRIDHELADLFVLARFYHALAGLDLSFEREIMPGVEGPVFFRYGAENLAGIVVGGHDKLRLRAAAATFAVDHAVIHRQAAVRASPGLGVVADVGTGQAADGADAILPGMGAVQAADAAHAVLPDVGALRAADVAHAVLPGVRMRRHLVGRPAAPVLTARRWDAAGRRGEQEPQRKERAQGSLSLFLHRHAQRLRDGLSVLSSK